MRPTRTTRGRDRRGPRLMPVAALLIVVGAAPAWGRDESPLSEPMVCPIDVPVRVASDDTLKRFRAMSDCAPDRIIVASPDGTLPVRASVNIAPRVGAIARLTRADKVAQRRIGDTAVQWAELGRSGTRVVRIIPTLPAETPVPVRAIDPTGAVAPPGAELTSAAVTGEAILSVRPVGYSSPYDDMIASAAARYRVDPLMLHSVITRESHYRPTALSRVGARGLMQIMPTTGAGLGVADPNRLLDPATNIQAGASLLRRLWDRMGGRFDLVLAAYNAGEGAVRRFGMRVPPFAETRSYVNDVQNTYSKLAMGAGLLKVR